MESAISDAVSVEIYGRRSDFEEDPFAVELVDDQPADGHEGERVQQGRHAGVGDGVAERLNVRALDVHAGSDVDRTEDAVAHLRDHVRRDRIGAEDEQWLVDCRVRRVVRAVVLPATKALDIDEVDEEREEKEAPSTG